MSVALCVRHTMCAGVLSISLFSISHASLALTVEDVPNPRQENGGWVTDMADLLSPATEADLNRQISQLESQNGTEIAVVTVVETAPASTPKAFTTQLFNDWGIGKADQDNGVLFLISQRDRRVEIETGYGIEPRLPNEQVRQIVEQKIIPSFKQGDFDAGTLAGTEALITALADETFDRPPANSTNPAPENVSTSTQASQSPDTPIAQKRGSGGWLVLLLILGLFGWVIRAATDHHRDDDGDGSGGKRSNRRFGTYSGGSHHSGGSGGYGGGFGGGSSVINKQAK